MDFNISSGCTEDRYKYIRVKISGLKTVITVVDRVDHEAFASDVVVKPATLESTHHGKINNLMHMFLFECKMQIVKLKANRN